MLSSIEDWKRETLRRGKRAWPLHSVMSTWEELWGRFTEELRSLDRRIRREMQEESPSFDRLRFFATSPGEPWLRLPQTFDL